MAQTFYEFEFALLRGAAVQGKTPGRLTVQLNSIRMRILANEREDRHESLGVYGKFMPKNMRRTRSVVTTGSLNMAPF